MNQKNLIGHNMYQQQQQQLKHCHSYHTIYMLRQMFTLPRSICLSFVQSLLYFPPIPSWFLLIKPTVWVHLIIVFTNQDDKLNNGKVSSKNSTTKNITFGINRNNRDLRELSDTPLCVTRTHNYPLCIIYTRDRGANDTNTFPIYIRKKGSCSNDFSIQSLGKNLIYFYDLIRSTTLVETCPLVKNDFSAIPCCF
jgi:hypothetical protein